MQNWCNIDFASILFAGEVIEDILRHGPHDNRVSSEETSIPTQATGGKGTAIRRGVLYNKQKEFQKAIDWLKEASKRYYKEGSQEANEIKLLIAKTYQDEGNWPEAEKLYHEIESQYPKSPVALQVPLLVASHYQALNENDKANQILQDALAQYKKIQDENPKSRISKYAKQFTNVAYGQRGEWNQVLTNIDNDIASQTVSANKGNYLFLKAMVTANGAKDSGKAIELYREFLKQYPDHPLASLAEKNIQILSAGIGAPSSTK